MSLPVGYFHPRCDTCRRARAWLREHGIEVDARDLTEAGPDRATLERAWRTSGLPLRRLFNTSGQSYRAGAFGERLGGMSDDEQLDALAADAMLVKRPLLLLDDAALVGFHADTWRAALLP
jgi:arsenate reductase